jgi:hypothetical protein
MTTAMDNLSNDSSGRRSFSSSFLIDIMQLSAAKNQYIVSLVKANRAFPSICSRTCPTRRLPSHFRVICRSVLEFSSTVRLIIRTRLSDNARTTNDLLKIQDARSILPGPFTNRRRQLPGSVKVESRFFSSTNAGESYRSNCDCNQADHDERFRVIWFPTRHE